MFLSPAQSLQGCASRPELMKLHPKMQGTLPWRVAASNALMKGTTLQ
jgi:hypothetical protein